jgi:hypothetical protein
MSESLDRRHFVQAAAVGASAALVTVAASRGDDKDKPREKAEEKPKAKAGDAEPPKEKRPAPRHWEADARMDLVLARYGKHLDSEDRKAVRAEVEMIVRRAESLRKFEITNADGPYPVFIPYRAPLA